MKNSAPNYPKGNEFGTFGLCSEHLGRYIKILLSEFRIYLLFGACNLEFNPLRFNVPVGLVGIIIVYHF